MRSDFVGCVESAKTHRRATQRAVRPRRLDAPYTYAPRIEPLEDRTLMSTCHVTRLTDQGVGKRFRGDLRYCINKVNAEPGPDVIDFTVTGTIKLNSALPNLASEIDIQGPGSELLTIDADQKARVLYIDAGASVEASRLTMTGGDTGDSGYPWADWQPGGGIYNAGSLVLHDCTISQNFGRRYGGGIYNEGTAWISSCSILENQVNVYPFYTWGAGIYNAAAGALFVSNTLISGNKIQPGFSYVAIGAGLANLGKAVVVHSTITGNIANPANYATWAGFGGGIYNGGNLLVDSSLISSNVAAGDYYGFGGGIANGTVWTFHPVGTVTVQNTTIAHNLAYANGESVNISRGGGISSTGRTVTVTHSTIAQNQSAGAPSDLVAEGGGISNEDGELQISNSIVAVNEAKSTGQDDISGAFTGHHNLIGAAPRLGPLADNGGPTLTMALLPGSPAIDAGDNTDAPEFDQRGPGFPRIVNGTIDIGAFEVQTAGAPSSPDHFAVLVSPISEALKGRDTPAQGNALGNEAIIASAVKGRNQDAVESGLRRAPLQGLVHRKTPTPRALPRADLFRPVGAEIDIEFRS